MWHIRLFWIYTLRFDLLMILFLIDEWVVIHRVWLGSDIWIPSARFSWITAHSGIPQVDYQMSHLI
ncbi:hypothetical protein C3F42_05135 [Pseudomonas sp. PONIH3]|nr:hypothetical protein C3F42_05135 [Pseudomonas sp. PONIH3]